MASGDPAADGLVLWTRLAPNPLEEAGGVEVLKPVLVDWEVSEDGSFSKPVQSGQTLAHPELGHSVHVEVAGLKPDRPYWYRFHIAGYESPIGRVRPCRASALPRPAASITNMVITPPVAPS